MTKSPSTTPSAAFGLESFIATASGIHPRTSRSYISSSKNMPDPKSSTSARSSPRENPRTLRSPAGRGQGLRSQIPVGTAAVNSRYTTLPTSTPLVRPLAAKIIPQGRGNGTHGRGRGRAQQPRRSTACFTAKTVRTQQGTARKRRLPGAGCLGRNQLTTQELLHTHISNSHNHTTTTLRHIHLTMLTNTTKRYKSYPPLPPPPPHQPNIHPPNHTKHPNKKTSLISRIAESFT
jgi:hypothetical protein